MLLMLVSPAKTLNLDPIQAPLSSSSCDFLNDSQELVDILKKMSPQDLGQLMSLSDKLAITNVERYQNWQRPFPSHLAKPAAYLFMGDVYEGLDCASLDADSLRFLDQHLRILSGLYGLLRPMDDMLPYRLEMGTKLGNPRGKHLYDFWGKKLTQAVNALLEPHADGVLLNLASNEYFKSIQSKDVIRPIVTPVFQDFSNGQYKVVSFYAKRARGLMARWVAEHKIEKASDLSQFDSEGYAFCPALSNEKELVFRRG